MHNIWGRTFSWFHCWQCDLDPPVPLHPPTQVGAFFQANIVFFGVGVMLFLLFLLTIHGVAREAGVFFFVFYTCCENLLILSVHVFFYDYSWLLCGKCTLHVWLSGCIIHNVHDFFIMISGNIVFLHQCHENGGVSFVIFLVVWFFYKLLGLFFEPGGTWFVFFICI